MYLTNAHLCVCGGGSSYIFICLKHPIKTIIYRRIINILKGNINLLHIGKDMIVYMIDVVSQENIIHHRILMI